MTLLSTRNAAPTRNSVPVTMAFPLCRVNQFIPVAPFAVPVSSSHPRSNVSHITHPSSQFATRKVRSLCKSVSQEHISEVGFRPHLPSKNVVSVIRPER
jgi:hypothetical protein